MIRLETAQRGMVRLLVPVLFAVLAVVGVASPAHADPRCTGHIRNSASSDAGTTVKFIFANGGSGTVDRGLGAVGSERFPIVKYTIWATTVAIVDYYDLRNGQWLDSTTVRGGTYNVNPCHKAVFFVYWA